MEQPVNGARSPAGATRVSDRSVHAWTRAGGIRPATYTGLSELRAVVLVLRDALTPRGVGQWLHAPNRMLAGRRPIDAAAVLGNPDKLTPIIFVMTT